MLNMYEYVTYYDLQWCPLKRSFNMSQDRTNHLQEKIINQNILVQQIKAWSRSLHKMWNCKKENTSRVFDLTNIHISLSDCLPDHSQIDAQARAYLPAKHIQAVNECERKQSNNDAKLGIG